MGTALKMGAIHTERGTCFGRGGPQEGCAGLVQLNNAGQSPLQFCGNKTRRQVQTPALPVSSAAGRAAAGAGLGTGSPRRRGPAPPPQGEAAPPGEAWQGPGQGPPGAGKRRTPRMEAPPGLPGARRVELGRTPSPGRWRRNPPGPHRAALTLPHEQNAHVPLHRRRAPAARPVRTSGPTTERAGEARASSAWAGAAPQRPTRRGEALPGRAPRAGRARSRQC